MVQFTPKIWLTIDLSFLVQSFKETFLVQSFKETLQYCDEWRNSHQAGSQSVGRSVNLLAFGYTTVHAVVRTNGKGS